MVHAIAKIEGTQDIPNLDITHSIEHRFALNRMAKILSHQLHIVAHALTRKGMIILSDTRGINGLRLNILDIIVLL